MRTFRCAHGASYRSLETVKFVGSPDRTMVALRSSSASSAWVDRVGSRISRCTRARRSGCECITDEGQSGSVNEGRDEAQRRRGVHDELDQGLAGRASQTDRQCRAARQRRDEVPRLGDCYRAPTEDPGCTFADTQPLLGPDHPRDVRARYRRDPGANRHEPRRRGLRVRRRATPRGLLRRPTGPRNRRERRRRVPHRLWPRHPASTRNPCRAEQLRAVQEPIEPATRGFAQMETRHARSTAAAATGVECAP